MWVAATAWLLTSAIGLRPGTEPRLPKWSALDLTARPALKKHFWLVLFFFDGRGVGWHGEKKASKILVDRTVEENRKSEADSVTQRTSVSENVEY